MILIGTANSKSLDSKKSKVVEAKKAGDKPKPKPTTCTMCGRFYYEKSACPEASTSMLTGPIPPILVPLGMHYL